MRLREFNNVAEGYQLHLERDTNMMVLHITDTKTGKRTEVRGKSGYENNGYDANDKLHQLLDKIGKSANVSELINGEIVTINPKHPKGASAKAATTTAFNESLDNPYPFNFTGPNTENTYFAKAQTPNGKLVMEFDGGYDDFNIDFAVGKSMGKTNAGDEFRVFATVVAMMNKWISVVGIEHVEEFSFGANKDEHASDGRAKLYARFAKKLATQLGWSLQQSSTGNNSTEFFNLVNPKPTPRPDGYFDALEDGKLGPNGEIPAEYTEGVTEGTSRTKLYTRFAKQMASQLGWRLEVNTRDTVDDFFKMHNPNAQVKESLDNDLNDVADWMDTTPDKLNIDMVQEPIEKFVQQIREMYDSYDEFPEEAERTNRIIKLLNAGEKAMPIYVAKGDPHLFVMEGRHRMVAFWQLGMKTIPVAYVSVKQSVKEAVEVSLHGDAKKGYVLSKIAVPGDERNAGQGTNAMQDIVDRMDAEGAIIALTPDDAFGGNKNRLIDFYKRFGFVPNKGRNKDFRFRETMIRYPQSSTSVQVEEITLDESQDFHEEFGYLAYCEEGLFEAEYQGRTVKLNKPMRGDVKKFKVYVKNEKGNVIKVNFGHGGTSAEAKGEKTMRIRKSNPAARKSFRARHNCENPGPKTKARYWSCRKW